jgi:hypothetical protein
MYFVTSQRGREVFVLETLVNTKKILNNPNVSRSWVGKKPLEIKNLLYFELTRLL